MALKNIKSNVVAEDILSGIQSAKYNFRRRRGLPKGMDTLKTAHTEMVVYTSILAGGLIGAVRRNLIKTPSDANVLCYAEYKGMQNLSSLLANAGFTHSHNFTSCQQFRASVAAIESPQDTDSFEGQIQVTLKEIARDVNSQCLIRMQQNLPFLINSNGASSSDISKIYGECIFEDVAPILRDIFGSSFSSQVFLPIFEDKKQDIVNFIYNPNKHTQDKFIAGLLSFTKNKQKLKQEGKDLEKRKQELENLGTFGKFFKQKSLQTELLEKAGGLMEKTTGLIEEMDKLASMDLVKKK